MLSITTLYADIDTVKNTLNSSVETNNINLCFINIIRTHISAVEVRCRHVVNISVYKWASGREDMVCVLSSPPNRYLFSSRCDSIYTEKKAKKIPQG